ncbi:MAG: hypothetical protein ACC631_12310 [Halocynthiibacter sp.]
MLVNIARVMSLPLVVPFSIWFYILRTGKQEPGPADHREQTVERMGPVPVREFSVTVAETGGPAASNIPEQVRQSANHQSAPTGVVLPLPIGACEDIALSCADRQRSEQQ